MAFTERINPMRFWVTCGLFVASLFFLIDVSTRPYDKFAAERPKMNTAAAMLTIKELAAGLVLENGPLPKDLDNRGLMKLFLATDMKKVVYRAFDHGELSWGGEILDGWGTPLQISTDPDRKKLHIRSAGPDKIFGTADDITNH